MRTKDDLSAGDGRAFDSPFLDAEILARESPADVSSGAPAPALESPFLDALSPGADPIDSMESMDAQAEEECEAPDTEDEEAEGDDESEAEVSEECEAGAGDLTTLRMRSVAARILWPALGFPAVIAPRATGSKDPSEGDPRWCICVLVLSNKKDLSTEDAARYLRIVPWSARTRRHIPDGQTGSFSAAELQVRNDGGGRPLSRPEKDALADAIVFGGNRDGNSVVVSLARRVREFYRRQGLEYLHEIRVSEAASGRLRDGQYQLFWNDEAPVKNAPSREMRLLIERFARPRREAPGPKLAKEVASLIDQYKFDFGALNAPYKESDKQKRLTEVLHPLFIQRVSGSLRIGHLTDAHVDVRADVYEENLTTAARPLSYANKRLLYKNTLVFYNNFNKSFIAAYRDIKQSSDVILLTGDLIDYGRGHIGLAFGPGFSSGLGDNDLYLEDRNWFLFYYLLASGDNYTCPVFTILGNHDWRLNPYPPFAPGTPRPSALIHNYWEFEGKDLKKLIQIAHGPGHEKGFAYSLDAESALELIFTDPVSAARGLAGKLDVPGSPLQTTVESVAWYLLLINPFLDFSFALPSGQQVLMLDWAQKEEVMNFEEVRSFTGFGVRASTCVTALQQWHLKRFAALPGKAKVVGIHAPPIGPYPAWLDQDLLQGKKVYQPGKDSRARKPDGTIVKLQTHSLFAIRPKDAPFGVAADYGSFLNERDWFIKKIAEPGAGIRLVLSGHIHRNGLLVAHVPSGAPNALLVRGVISQAVRGIRHPGAAIRPHTASSAVKTYPAPLYVNTTSAGPRGHLHQTAEAYVNPGYAIIRLSSDGTIDDVSVRQVALEADSRLKARQVAS